MDQGDRKASALILSVSILLACSCSLPPENGTWDEPRADTVGWLGDQPVTYGQVGQYIQLREPDVFSRSLTRYILERVTVEEAQPLGIKIPEAVLARETSRRMREWERRVRAAAKSQTGQEIEPALWLQRIAGLSLADFRARVRDGATVELVQDRLLRYEQLKSRRIEVSVLVVLGKPQAEKLRDRIGRGGDFAVLARKHSQHASAQNGGRIPFPLLEPDINETDVRKALFAANAGALVGPFPIGDQGYQQLYRVEAAQGPRKGGYAELEREIARDLEARPVPVGEYERWRRRILLRHGFRADAAPGELG